MIFMNRRSGVFAAGRRYHRRVLAAPLDDLPLLRSSMLPVGDGHLLNVQQFGRAQGIPALLLHGGPGSGCTPGLRRGFDARRYHLVCIDQRGAGASKPRGATHANTTAHLVADIEHVREHLGIPRWLVAGGSWGATLALAYAAAHPRAVAALLLRNVFLARREDVDAFFDGRLHLPTLAAALAGDDSAAQRDAALAWWRHECMLAGAASAPPRDPQALIDRYRVQAHYLLHDCWLTPHGALGLRAPAMPTLLLQGRADRICPPAGARLLQAVLPHAALQEVDAGHDPTQPALAAALAAALNGYADSGAFMP